MKTTFYFIVISLTIEMSCSSKSLTSSLSKDSGSSKRSIEKVRFDLGEVDENGLTGSADGRREMAYEFCISLSEAKRKEVAAIDTTVQFYNGPSGRIGCGKHEYLCIGSGKPEVILKLANLNYIKKIIPFYGE